MARHLQEAGSAKTMPYFAQERHVRPARLRVRLLDQAPPGVKMVTCHA
jgi:hypothetical protein